MSKTKEYSLAKQSITLTSTPIRFFCCCYLSIGFVIYSCKYITIKFNLKLILDEMKQRIRQRRHTHDVCVFPSNKFRCRGGAVHSPELYLPFSISIYSTRKNTYPLCFTIYDVIVATAIAIILCYIWYIYICVAPYTRMFGCAAERASKK